MVIFLLFIRLLAVVRQPSYNLYDDCSITCTAAAIQVVLRPLYRHKMGVKNLVYVAK